MGETPFIDLLKAVAAAGALIAAVLALTRLLGNRRWFAHWLERPFQFVAISVTIWLFFRVAGLTAFEGYADAVVVAAVLGGLVHVVVNFIFTVFFSRKRDIHLPPLLRNVILTATYLTILVIALKVAVPGFSLSPLVLASGVLSLVVGLALQDVLSNLIAGVTLSVEKPLRKDDWVLIEGQEGKVVEITWRTTKILTRQNDYIIFPNRLVAERQLHNYIYPSRLHRPILAVDLPYSTLPSIAEEALLEAASKTTGVLPRPRPRVLLRGFEESSISYGLVVSIDDFDNYYIIMSDLRKEIFYALKRYGIVIPFPIRTVYVQKGEKHPAEWKGGYRHRLVAVEGPRRGEILPLEEKKVSIGRGSDCDLDLNDPVVSKEHARIEYSQGRYYVVDCDSKHGTTVNGVAVEKQELRSGDEIGIGETVLRFEQLEFA